jgi:hypothetical protein
VSPAGLELHVARQATICERDTTARVEIVVDPVHFCSSAVKARAKALHLMTKLRMQAGMNLARISSLTSQDFGET